MAHLAKLGAVLAIVLRNVFDIPIVLPESESDDDDVIMALQHQEEAAFVQLVDDLTAMGALSRPYTQHSSYWVKPRQPSFIHETAMRFFEPCDWLLH